MPDNVSSVVKSGLPLRQTKSSSRKRVYYEPPLLICAILNRCPGMRYIARVAQERSLQSAVRAYEYAASAWQVWASLTGVWSEPFPLQMLSTNRAELVSTLKDETFLADFYPAFLAILCRLQGIDGPQHHFGLEAPFGWRFCQESLRLKAEITVFEQKLTQEIVSLCGRMI